MNFKSSVFDFHVSANKDIIFSKSFEKEKREKSLAGSETFTSCRVITCSSFSETVVTLHTNRNPRGLGQQDRELGSFDLQTWHDQELGSFDLQKANYGVLICKRAQTASRGQTHKNGLFSKWQFLNMVF